MNQTAKQQAQIKFPEAISRNSRPPRKGWVGHLCGAGYPTLLLVVGASWEEFTAIFARHLVEPASAPPASRTLEAREGSHSPQPVAGFLWNRECIKDSQT